MLRACLVLGAYEEFRFIGLSAGATSEAEERLFHFRQAQSALNGAEGHDADRKRLAHTRHD
jgi:hypothetical protein